MAWHVDRRSIRRAPQGRDRATVKEKIPAFPGAWTTSEADCPKLSLEAVPKRVPGGYVCDLCPPGSRPVFPNRPSLWTAELFEPFLQWVNEGLAKAKWLALYGSPDFAAWARLSGEDAAHAALHGGGSLPNLSAWVGEVEASRSALQLVKEAGR